VSTWESMLILAPVQGDAAHCFPQYLVMRQRDKNFTAMSGCYICWLTNDPCVDPPWGKLHTENPSFSAGKAVASLNCTKGYACCSYAAAAAGFHLQLGASMQHLFWHLSLLLHEARLDHIRLSKQHATSVCVKRLYTAMELCLCNTLCC